MPNAKGYTRIHNPNLTAEAVGNGLVEIVDVTFDALLDAGLLDSEDIPSAQLLEIIEGILGQLGLTWANDPDFWDPMDRTLGGAIWIQGVWRRVE